MQIDATYQRRARMIYERFDVGHAILGEVNFAFWIALVAWLAQ